MLQLGLTLCPSALLAGSGVRVCRPPLGLSGERDQHAGAGLGHQGPSPISAIVGDLRQASSVPLKLECLKKGMATGRRASAWNLEVPAMTGIWGANEHHFVNSPALLMLLIITMSQAEPAPSEAQGPRQGGAG